MIEPTLMYAPLPSGEAIPPRPSVLLDARHVEESSQQSVAPTRVKADPRVATVYPQQLQSWPKIGKPLQK